MDRDQITRRDLPSADAPSPSKREAELLEENAALRKQVEDLKREIFNLA